MTGPPIVIPDQDDPAVRAAQEERLRAVWAPPRGLFFKWTDTNNNAVGTWYTLTAFAMMLFAGVLGLIMRAQLAVPDNDLVAASTYNQLFTLHGSAMMFLFAVPMFEAVSVLLLPQLLGARDLPFPRLSAFGYWSFLLGAIFVSGSIFFDAAPDGGWFMYPPLSTEPATAGIGADIWMPGLTFIEVSSVAAAIKLIQPFPWTARAAVMALAAFGAVVALGQPLVLVLALLLPVSIVWAWIADA